MIKNKQKVYPERSRKVIVAMSGGVDSSVAAALLKKQGYDVVGIFMRFWHETRNSADQNADERGNENSCCSEGAEAAARAVAVKLKIPFYVFNFAREFKKEVVDYFLAEQARGSTPNPCVVCNKKIKFGLLFEKALAMGADFLATGHYARVKKVSGTLKKGYLTPLYKLYSAKDKNKDQSYFLHQLNQRQLSRIIFPLADYTKDEVTQLAKKWRLPCRREQSFDLCFMKSDHKSFIKKYLKLKPGTISDLKENILGSHDGLAIYTIGQRKSISLSRGPWWVVKKNERRNILYVSNNEKDLYAKELVAEKIYWVGGQAPRLRQSYGGQAKMPLKVLAKIRYKSEAGKAILRGPTSEKSGISRGRTSPKSLRVVFTKPQRAITPGQSVVFYSRAGEVLGGGVIE